MLTKSVNLLFATKTAIIILLFGVMPCTALHAQYYHEIQAAELDSNKSQLTDFLRQAAEKNPELKAAFHNYLATLEEAPQVGTLPDPEIAFGYFINPIETRVGPQEARFSISQMFPWFGTLDARENSKLSEAGAKYQEFQNTRNLLFYRIKSVWYNLYVNQTHIEIIEENIGILESLEELALQKYETAQRNQSDVLQVQIELEDLRIDKSRLVDNRHILKQELRELLNADSLDLPEKIEVDIVDLPKNKQQLRRQMLAANPSLTQLSFKKEAAEHSITSAKRNGLPKFGLGVDYIMTGERDIEMPNNGQDAFLARASIQIPLFRGKYRAEKQEARLKLNAIRNRQSARENQLITVFEKTLRDYRDASRKVELYESKQIERTRQAIDILTDQYGSAGTDFEDILRLQRRLLDYQQTREQAIGNKNTAVAYIEYLTGHYNLKSDKQ